MSKDITGEKELKELIDIHKDGAAYLDGIKKLAGVKPPPPLLNIESKLKLFSPKTSRHATTTQINLFHFNEESIMEGDTSIDDNVVDFLKDASNRLNRRLTATYKEAKGDTKRYERANRKIIR